MEPHNPTIEQKLEDLIRITGTNQSLPLIIDGLKDSEWRIRKAAVEAGCAYPDLSALIPELINAIADPDNVGRRNAAAELLASIGDRAVSVLILKLEDPDPDVRIFAANVLGEIRSPLAIPALIRRLEDPDENVRLVAIEHLGSFDDPTVDNVLINLLRTSDVIMQFAAIEALAAHDARLPLEILTAIEMHSVLRPGIFRALRSGRQLEAWPIIAKGLLDRARSSREAAIVAISELIKNYPAMVPEISTFLGAYAAPETVLRIAQALNTDDVTLRRATVDALGLIPNEAAMSQLIAMAEDDDLLDIAGVSLARIARGLSKKLFMTWEHANERERALIARAFGVAFLTEATDRLIAILDSDYGHLVSAGARALGELGASKAIPDIAILLTHPYPDIRTSAADALQRLASVDEVLVTQHVLPHTSADTAFIREAAASVLAALHGSDVNLALNRLLKDPEAAVRAAALSSLNPNFLSGAFDSVAPMLADESPEVRRVVVDTIAKIRHPRSLEILDSALDDSDLWVRIGTVRSLGMLTGGGAVDRLTKLLAQPDLPPPLISETLKAIEKKDPQRIRDVALPLLSSSEIDVILACLETLSGAPRSPELGDPLIRLLDHEHWDVRSKAALVYALHLGESARTTLLGRLRVEGDALVHKSLRFALDQIAQKNQ